jgi:hypothetical protein
MKEFDLNVQDLLDEFLNLSVEIKTKDPSYQDIDHPINQINPETGDEDASDYLELWDFDMIFNRNFTIQATNLKDLKQDAFYNYQKYIEEKKSNAYKEIDNFVISTISRFEKINYLTSIIIRFKEVQKRYYFITKDKRSEYYKLIDNQTIIRSIPDSKHIDKWSEKRMSNVFLAIQVNAIKSLLRFVKAKLEILNKEETSLQIDRHSPFISKETKTTDEVIRDQPLKERQVSSKNSFEINPSIYNSDPKKADSTLSEKLKDFHQALYKYGFIGKIDFRDFLLIFTNKPIRNKIRWETDAKELYYLMKKLYEKDLIVHFKNYWDITCKCFIAYHKKSRVATPHSLSRCHPPTLNARLTRLHSVIDTLK